MNKGVGAGMENRQESPALRADQLESVSGGTGARGIYRPGFQHRKESLQFFKACVGEDVYDRAMNSAAGRAHHYTVARAFLNQRDWEKFVWIEEYGSLDGFSEE